MDALWQSLKDSANSLYETMWEDAFPPDEEETSKPAAATGVRTVERTTPTGTHEEENDAEDTDENRILVTKSMYAANLVKWNPEGAVPDLTPAQVAQRCADGSLVLVDARTDEERAVSTIPGSLSQSMWKDAVATGAIEDAKDVCFFCTFGLRSGKAAAVEHAARAEADPKGPTAYNLNGGLVMWAHAGLPLVDPATSRPVKAMHVYGKAWIGLPPKSFQVVIFPPKE